MVKYLIIIMLVASTVYAKGELSGKFEVAKSIHNEEELSSFNFEFDYTYEILKIKNSIYGGSRVWYYYDGFQKPLEGYPFRDIYTIGYKVKYDIFYFKLDHFCNHAVYTRNSRQGWYSNKWNETMTSYILGIEFKIK